MPQLKELLVEQLQDLLHAETQLTGALPKMAEAAHHPKLKEAFEKHLVQTEDHVERLRNAFSLLGEQAEPKPCKAMMGLVEEGKETIEEGREKEPLAADLALIATAQRVEHYEISGLWNRQESGAPTRPGRLCAPPFAPSVRRNRRTSCYRRSPSQSCSRYPSTMPAHQ